MALNPWLDEQLRKTGGSTLSVILEVPTSKEGYARNIIQSIGSITGTSHILGTSFITISIDSSKLPELSSIGQVHYNMPRGIALTTMGDIKKPNIMKDILFKEMGMEIGISEVEVPTTPMNFIRDAFDNPISNYIFISTSKTVSAIKDTPNSVKYTGKNVQVAVIDTGFVPRLTHPMLGNRVSKLYSIAPEPPNDAHGHGSWCSFTVLGSPFNHPVYGKCEGVAPNAISTHIKSLNSLGMGKTSDILKSLETASNKGIKVVSMSLGGPAQGGVDDDPESKIIQTLSDSGMIFVIAAGNDGVDWSIGSPGINPAAITVGSQSMTDNDLSWFSSRGPQSSYYKDHVDEYNRDLAKYGDDLIKPDVVCYGGGRSLKTSKDEVLFNGSVGWFAPFYHKIPDGFGAMHGTSQATPHVAGLIACLVEAGLINTSKDFKKLISTSQKSSSSGYGLSSFSRFSGA